MANEVNFPDLETARNNLFRTTYAESFFSKLAEYGFVPQSEPQAKSLLDIGSRCLALSDQQTNKSASADPYAEALVALDNTLQRNGVTAPQAAQKQARAIKIAQALASDPDIYASTLVVADAELRS